MHRLVSSLPGCLRSPTWAAAGASDSRELAAAERVEKTGRLEPRERTCPGHVAPVSCHYAASDTPQRPHGYTHYVPTESPFNRGRR
jgi:hypothetical protein